MADEKDKKNGNGKNGDGDNEAAAAAKKAAEEKQAKRKERLEARTQTASATAAEAARQRAAAGRAAEAEKQFGIDLSGIEDEGLRTEVQGALTAGETASKNATSLAVYAMDQARLAAAQDIAIELEMLDSVKEIEASLRGANTPAELELSKREVRLELASEQAESNDKEDEDESHTNEDGKGGGRRFDGARGAGANRQAELVKKINAIDPADPEAEKKLDELYAEVREAQTRSTKK